MFAEFLPRLLVMLVIVAVGLVVAYALKTILRAVLHVTRLDRLSEEAGASHFAHGRASSMTELLAVAILGNLVRIYFDRDKRAGRRRSSGTNLEIIFTVAAIFVAILILFLDW